MGVCDSIRTLFVTLAMAGMAVAETVPETIPAGHQPADVPVYDLRLDREGRLTGVVVNSHGQTLSEIQVRYVPTAGGRFRPTQPRSTVSDSQGVFQFERLSAGACQIRTEQGICTCRLWSHDAAPPSAAKSLLIVHDTLIQRGQRPIHELFHSDPVLMATIVAAAIAIPIAVHKSRDDAPPGS